MFIERSSTWIWGATELTARHMVKFRKRVVWINTYQHPNSWVISMAAAIPAARGSHDDGDRNTIPGGCSWTGEPLKEAAWAWTHSFSPKWLMHHAPLHVFEVLFSCGKCWWRKRRLNTEPMKYILTYHCIINYTHSKTTMHRHTDLFLDQHIQQLHISHPSWNRSMEISGLLWHRPALRPILVAAFTVKDVWHLTRRWPCRSTLSSPCSVPALDIRDFHEDLQLAWQRLVKNWNILESRTSIYQ